MIATGFDRKAIARPAPAASETPTDLNIYSAHLSRAAVPQQVAVGYATRRPASVETPQSWLMRRGFPSAGAAPTVGVSRRPVVELSLSSLGTSERGVSRRRERLRGKHAARRARLPAATVVRAARGWRRPVCTE